MKSLEENKHKENFWLVTRHYTDHKFLAPSLDVKEIMRKPLNFLSKEQTLAIFKLHSKYNIFHNNYTYHSNVEYGAYFSLIYGNLDYFFKYTADTRGKNNYYYFIFDARKLLRKIINDILESGISTKNMIYHNIYWDEGYIIDYNDNIGVIIEPLTKDSKATSINKAIEDFLQKAQANLDEDTKTGLWDPIGGELIIKWIIPCNKDYGLFKVTNEFTQVYCDGVSCYLKGNIDEEDVTNFVPKTR